MTPDSLLVLLIGFFIVAYYTKDNGNHAQYAILRWLITLSAGLAASLFTGELGLNIQGILPASKLVLQASAGFGLATLVYLTYPRYVPKPAVGLRLSIPEGWTLKATLTELGRLAGRTVNLDTLTEEEQALPLRATRVAARTLEQAITQLRYATPNIPALAARVEAGTIVVTKP